MSTHARQGRRQSGKGRALWAEWLPHRTLDQEGDCLQQHLGLALSSMDILGKGRREDRQSHVARPVPVLVLPSSRHFFPGPSCPPGLGSPPFPGPWECLFTQASVLFLSSPGTKTLLLCTQDPGTQPGATLRCQGDPQPSSGAEQMQDVGKNELDIKWHQIQTGNIYFGSQGKVPFSSAGFSSMTGLATVYLDLLE